MASMWTLPISRDVPECPKGPGGGAAQSVESRRRSSRARAMDLAARHHLTYTKHRVASQKLFFLLFDWACECGCDAGDLRADDTATEVARAGLLLYRLVASVRRPIEVRGRFGETGNNRATAARRKRRG